MDKIIYIASPYSHLEKHVRDLRYLQVTDYVANLVIDGNIAFSPITFGHILSEHKDIPTDFKFWESFCLTFLDRCNEMYILKIDGWDKSEGIKAEIDYCLKKSIPIKYIDFEEGK